MRGEQEVQVVVICRDLLELAEVVSSVSNVETCLCGFRASFMSLLSAVNVLCRVFVV
jgi:hypothetical protein